MEFPQCLQDWSVSVYHRFIYNSSKGVKRLKSKSSDTHCYCHAIVKIYYSVIGLSTYVVNEPIKIIYVTLVNKKFSFACNKNRIYFF